MPIWSNDRDFHENPIDSEDLREAFEQVWARLDKLEQEVHDLSTLPVQHLPTTVYGDDAYEWVYDVWVE